MKIVRSAATEDRTGEVSEIRTRKDPEKATQSQYLVQEKRTSKHGIRTSIRQHRNRHHARLFSPRQRKLLPSHVMQNGQRNPEHTDCKQPDQTSKHVREDDTLVWTCALRRTRQPLVQNFVEAIKHASDTNDEVAKSAVLSFMRWRRLVAACAASGFRTVFGGGHVAVCDDEDTGDSDCHGDDFARSDFFV